jgi:single-stranded DNA-binding protein
LYVKTALTEGSLTKGTRIGIVGRLVQERWKGNDGKTNSRVVIMAEAIDIYAAKNKAASSESAPLQAASSSIDDF